jgi:hypothetical protein
VRTVRRGMLLAAALVAAGALAPAAAQAHGIEGNAELPIPAEMFAWAAAIVLIVSFVALGVLWPAARLQQPRLRRVATIPRGLRTLCGLVGVALYGVVVYAALAGSDVPTANLAPTAIYVAFWVGIPVLSVLLGDVFALFSPWRALHRWIAGAARRVSPRLDAAPLAYPTWLGRWPAALGLAAFAWVELAYVERDEPATLGVLALAYGLVQLIGMSLFGERAWSERGDAFGVYFNLCARLSIWETRGRELCRRAPLSGLPRLDPLPGTVAVLVVLIGATTFDGASNGVLWVDLAPRLLDRFSDLGASLTVASELTATVGLALAFAAVAAFYELGIRGMRTLDPRRRTRELARAFVHTLAPIAFAYALAHYVSLLVFQGQALISLVSDPLGTGADLFGTASTQVDYTLVSSTAIWYAQVAALVGGHVAGLVLAHDRALTVFPDDRRAAVRSQYWMLTVMVGFTCLGLWLLSAVNA